MDKKFKTSDFFEIARNLKDITRSAVPDDNVVVLSLDSTVDVWARNRSNPWRK